MRITKDLTNMLLSHTIPLQETEDEFVEITDYNKILKPSLDSFFTAFFPLKNGTVFSLTETLIKLDVLLNIFIDRFSEERMFKKIQEQNKKIKAENIKKSVRSYKESFVKFNKENTMFETDGDGVRRRGTINLPKKRL